MRRSMIGLAAGMTLAFSVSAQVYKWTVETRLDDRANGSGRPLGQGIAPMVIDMLNNAEHAALHGRGTSIRASADEIECALCGGGYGAGVGIDQVGKAGPMGPPKRGLTLFGASGRMHG